jgi:quinoprotein glucose dehydrogenase
MDASERIERFARLERREWLGKTRPESGPRSGVSVGALVGWALPVALLLFGASLVALSADAEQSEATASEWTAYGGGNGALRYSPLSDIRAQNLSRLEVAWVHHTGEISDGTGEIESRTAYEVTPILVDGTLYLCSPFNRVFALDPESGEERWVYDPEIDLTARYANQAVCRGVSTWLDGRVPEAKAIACRRRIFTGTNDGRLIALDAATGKPCEDFGDAGQVDLLQGVGEQEWQGEYQVTSPPAVIHDLVVVGSAVSDNRRVDAPSGVVRAYDARSGALRWAWNPLPEGFDNATPPPEGALYRTGTANVWSIMTVDEERDLVFAPTGNPSPDFYGGQRNGSDHYASSIVALRGTTGEVVWHFQTVHHDLWDYDVSSQPTLVDLPREGSTLPAVVQATKMGHLFVLHRETGEPLFPVEERPVPQGGVKGEKLSPTQPFPVKPPPLIPASLSEDDAWGLTFWDEGWCRERMRAFRNEGIFTPPSLQGTLLVPGNAGGSNWGSVAVDPVRSVLIANVSHLPFVVSLFPAEEYERRRAAEPGVEISPQRGTPYGMRREIFLSPLGLPCVKPPWGMLTAVDLRRGEILWQVRLGTVRDIAPVPIPWKAGTPTLGGPLVTAGGLVFIGAAMDHYIRAFDIRTGEELWKGRLDAGAIATPMTYRARPGGKQYLVIAAGGHARSGVGLGDALVAYALRDRGARDPARAEK